MAAWPVITVSDVNDYLVGAQAAAIRTAARASGQADTFERVMQDRSNYVRNRIAGRVQLSGTDYAVPPELVTQTILLIIEALQVRIPGLSLDEDQKEMIRTAKKDLDIAGTEDLRVSTPDDAIDADVQGASSVSIVTKSKRVVTRDTMKGL